MELRHIRYFLAVAEEGNFTRAARRLGIGQPPLSQQIRDLEREVGVQLFHRVPHGAELTSAGAVFRDRVAELPGAASAAAEAARRAARGEIGELRLGITGTAALNPVVPRLIRDFRAERPGLALHLTEANSLRLRDDLLEGRLDVAILRSSIGDPPELRSWPLADEALLAALPVATDRGTPRVALADLAELPLILTPRDFGTSLHDAAVAACRAAGFEPRPGQTAPQVASILSLVSAGLGFSLLPESMRQFSVEGVVFRPLSDPETRVAISVAARRSGMTATVTAFVEKARQLGRRARNTGEDPDGGSDGGQPKA